MTEQEHKTLTASGSFNSPTQQLTEANQNLIFGKYEVIRRIALGGMGEVFLSRQTGVAVDRLVILKSLLPELAEQEGFVDQFLDEARVAATLNHPNIVGIYEVGLWNGQYFIAMEFIHGTDLSKLMREAKKQEKKVPFEVSAKIVHDAALGLDHAHSAVAMDGTPLNIVHRDISPQNIMVRGDGVTKVVDFGIAKASNRSTRTATGMLKGKLQYMPPEQIRGDDIDGRADQFALGVCLWEMTTGKRLFKGENELKTLEKILKEPVPLPSSLIPDYPQELEAIIMRMIHREPEKRYERLADCAREIQVWLDKKNANQATVVELVSDVLSEELRKVTDNLTPSQENFIINLGDSTAAASLNATPTTMTTVMDMRKRKNTGLIAAGIASVVLLAGVGFLLTIDDDDPIPGGSNTPTVPTVAKSDVGSLKDFEQATWTRFTKSLQKGADGKDLTLIDLNIGGPEGATVSIDGTAWPEKVPTVVTDLTPGPHEITLTTLDGTEKKFKFDASQAKTKDVFADQKSTGGLDDLKKTARADFKKVTTKTKAGEITLIDLAIGEPVGSIVTVDGKEWKERVPTVITGLSPGQHEIALTAKDGTKKSFKFQTEKAVSINQVVQLEVIPSDAELKVTQNGTSKRRGADESLDFLKPGKVSILVSRAGYKSQTLKFDLKKGQSITKAVELEKKAAPVRKTPIRKPRDDNSGGGGNVTIIQQAKEPGTLTIQTKPWAKVYVDGKPRGSTPLFKLELKPGKHKVKLVNDGAEINVTKTITIKSGKNVKKKYTLK